MPDPSGSSGSGEPGPQWGWKADLLDGLRSPLAAALLGTQVIEQALKRHDLAKAQRLLVPLASVLRRLSRLVDSLLDAKRIEAGENTLQLSEVRPETLLSRVADELDLILALHGLALELDLPPGLPPLNADGDLLFRGLMGLIEAAIRCSLANAQLRLSAAEQAPGCRITLAALGSGAIPWDKSVLGFGFAFCEAAVQAHGGRVTLGHGPDHENSVTLWLPLQPSHSRVSVEAG